MASSMAIRRLTREYNNIMSNPVEGVLAKPMEDNILSWRFLVDGPKGSVYENGKYYGKLEFPPNYPLKPPTIYMITPNGKFHTNKPICTTNSSYHSSEYNPLWSVSSIILGLVSLMDEPTAGIGHINSSDEERRELAYKSMEYNLSHPEFCSVFYEFLEWAYI